MQSEGGGRGQDSPAAPMEVESLPRANDGLRMACGKDHLL